MVDSVWLVKTIITDEATFSVEKTIGVCTNAHQAEILEKEAKAKNLQTSVEEVPTNTLFGF